MNFFNFKIFVSCGRCYYKCKSFSNLLYLFYSTFFWLYSYPGVHCINLREDSDFPHEQIKLSLLFMVSIWQYNKRLRVFFISFFLY